jgi:hypothetical protein
MQAVENTRSVNTVTHRHDTYSPESWFGHFGNLERRLNPNGSSIETRLVQTGFLSWPIDTVLDAAADRNSLGKRLLSAGKMFKARRPREMRES